MFPIFHPTEGKGIVLVTLAIRTTPADGENFWDGPNRFLTTQIQVVKKKKERKKNDRRCAFFPPYYDDGGQNRALRANMFLFKQTLFRRAMTKNQSGGYDTTPVKPERSRRNWPRICAK